MQVVMTIAFSCYCLFVFVIKARNPTATSVTLFPLLIWPFFCIYACAFIPEL